MGLRPNHRFTPRIEELLARLGSTVSFAEARALRHRVLGVTVSAATVWQRTSAAGAATLAVVGGAWTDVKLAVFAELAPGPGDAAGAPTTEAHTLSYAARWEPAESFGATITLEAQRRGIDEARTVVSPNDGAERDPA